MYPFGNLAGGIEQLEAMPTPECRFLQRLVRSEVHGTPSLGRTSSSRVRTSEAKLDAATTAVEHARQQDAAALAVAISDGGTSTARATRRAAGSGARARLNAPAPGR